MTISNLLDKCKSQHNENDFEKSDDELVECLLEMCCELDNQCKREEVIKVCEEIFKIDKDNEEAMIHKAYALAFLGKNDELLKYADYGIKTHPEVPAFYLLKGDVAYHNLKELDEAIALYEKGLALLGNPRGHWSHTGQLIWALSDKADLLIESGNFKDAVQFLDRILFYRPDEFEALNKLNSLIHIHNIDYSPTEHYRESLKLNEASQKRIKQINDFLNTIVIAEYDEDYVNGCDEFKDYNSFEEYVRDVLICLMETYPGHSEEDSRFLAKCRMDYIRSSFEAREPAAYCIIDVEYCCG